MTQVYLSYHAADVRLAQRYVQALAADKFEVFSKLDVFAGHNWASAVKSELARAKAVVALFTRQSIGSEWFLSEADLALRSGKLIPVRAAGDFTVPPGFKKLGFTDLTAWQGDRGDPRWAQLLQALSQLTGGRVAPAPQTVEVRSYKHLAQANATQIFLAHAGADKPLLRPIVETLIDQGFQLWIDRPQAIGLTARYEERISKNRIAYGADWREAIRLAIRQSGVVLAFWSRDAVEGRREQFHYEVYQAMMQEKLHQCRIDDVTFESIGMPYTFHHIADLSSHSAGRFDAELQCLMEDMVLKRRA